MKTKQSNKPKAKAPLDDESGHKQPESTAQNDAQSFLPPSYRAELITKLQSLNYADAASLSDSQLIEKLQEIASNGYSSTKDEARTQEQRINALFEGTNLRDMEFKIRLYEAGVDHRYVHLFKDSDARLILQKKNKKGELYYDMEPIWKIIRGSGINPLTPQEIFKTHHKEPKIVRVHTLNK
jgi:hypothetical protein